MSNNLTNCIVNHIFDNLGLTIKTEMSLKSDSFLIDDKIEMLDEDNKELGSFSKIWGAQANIHSHNFKLMLTDISYVDTHYALIIKLDGCPSYACYLSIDKLSREPFDGLICFSINQNNWLEANAGIQGTFLAGMENLKDITSAWKKIEKYDSLLDDLKSFLRYQESVNDGEE